MRLAPLTTSVAIREPPPLIQRRRHVCAFPRPPFFIAFSLCIPGPGVDAGDLEAEVPRARVLALPLGPGADAVAVRLALLPPAAVRPAVVEVEPPARHVQLGPGHACSWGEGEVGSSVGSGLLVFPGLCKAIMIWDCNQP